VSDEVRIVDPVTGGEKGQKQARFGGADARALLEEAKVYGFGEEKYARFNYLKGYRWSLSIDALFRHLFAFMDGEDRDPESGLLHTAHVTWHARTLSSFLLRALGTDDRYKPAVEPDTYVAQMLRTMRSQLVTREEAFNLAGITDEDLDRVRDSLATMPQDASEYESGTSSQMMADLAVTVANSPDPGFPEGCPHPSCIKAAHPDESGYHEDWNGSFYESATFYPPSHYGDV